jgi:signal peptidase II
LNRLRKPLMLALVLIAADQALKIAIKTQFALGDSVELLPWFQLHFTENPGMAFGLNWGGAAGKVVLSLFRIAAIGGIVWYAVHLAKKGAHPFVLTTLALIFAGALGNVLDSLFYGLLFDRGLVWSPEYEFWMAYDGVAQWGGGYAAPLLGNVVDMLYFPLWTGYLPEWLPFWGGDYFQFFRPIFNLADAYVTVGVVFWYLASRRPEWWPA